jgi:hypothetical protein
LKAIIDNSHTNTLSSATAARTALSSLDVYMEKLPKSDISKMNEYVKTKLNELAAANEMTTDLIMNLFKGYAKAKDKTFRAWFQREKDEYTNRRIIYDPNGLALMETVENYYKGRVEEGLWGKLNEDEQTILALKAQIANKQGGKGKGKGKRDGEERKGKGGGKENDKPKPAWKTQPPKDGEPKTKVMDGKTWHWCPHHNEWTVHPPAECRKRKANSEKSGKQEKGKKKDGKKKDRQLTLKVMQTLADHTEDMDDDSCYST